MGFSWRPNRRYTDAWVIVYLFYAITRGKAKVTRKFGKLHVTTKAVDSKNLFLALSGGSEAVIWPHRQQRWKITASTQLEPIDYSSFRNFYYNFRRWLFLLVPVHFVARHYMSCPHKHTHCHVCSERVTFTRRTIGELHVAQLIYNYGDRNSISETIIKASFSHKPVKSRSSAYKLARYSPLLMLISFANTLVFRYGLPSACFFGWRLPSVAVLTHLPTTLR